MKNNKLISSIISIIIGCALLIGMPQEVAAKTLVLKEVNNITRYDKDVYSRMDGSIYCVEPNIYVYNTKTNKVKTFKKADEKYKSYWQIYATKKYVYAISMVEGGTANSIDYLVRINKKNKKVKKIALTDKYYVYNKRLIFKEYNLIKDDEFGRVMIPTGRYKSVNFEGKKAKIEKNIEIQNAYDNLSTWKYQYNVDETGKYVYRTNLKNKKKIKIFKAKKNERIYSIQICDGYVKVTGEITNDNKGNRISYIVKENGKKKKMIKKWFDQ